MKKFLSLLVTMTLVFTLASCSGNETTEPTPDTPDTTDNSTDKDQTVDKGKVIVGRWGGNDAETAAFAQMLADFTAETGIEVEERVYSDFNTEIQAELIGGTAPDVFYVDAYMAPFFISQGILMPLNAAEFELSEFYQPLRDAFMQDGEYYAVSKDYSTLALYYNKAMVNEADIPTTMEEIWEGTFLNELRATLPEGVAPLTVNIDLARNMFIAQNGGTNIVTADGYSNIGSPAVVANLKPQLEAWANGLMVQPSDLGMGWNGDAFGQEMTAMMIEGNWVLGFLQQNFPDVDFGVLEVPTYSDDKGTMVFTVGYGINAAAKNTANAKEFVKYATGTEGMATWTSGAGVLPSRMDVTENTNVADDPLKQPHIAGAAYATPWQAGTNLDTVNTEFRNYAPSIKSGDRTVDEALQVAEDEANGIIATN